MTKTDLKSSRYKAIEGLRFLSIFQICIWHMSYPITSAGFLGVEFFFVLAGFFMYGNAVKSDSLGVCEYTARKLSKFYFKLILTLILTHAVYYQGVMTEFQRNMLHPLLRFISEALLLQSLGIFESGLNKPVWFFSILIYGGAIVYALAKYYTKLSIRIIFPVVLVLYFAYTFKNGTIETLENWDVVGIVPIAMARGFSEIGLGILVGYGFYMYGEKISRHIKVLNCVSMISLALYVAIIVDGREYAQYALIFIPILICSALIRETVINQMFTGEFWLSLGRLSFDVFIIHYPLLALFRHFLFVECGLPLWGVAMLYYIALIPSAYVFDKVAQYLHKLIFRGAEMSCSAINIDER